MQELLSRAVEEQVGEQRHLADALTELRELVARLPGDVGDAAATNAADVSAALSGLREELARTGASVEATAARVDALSDRLNGLDALAERLPTGGTLDPDTAAAVTRSAVAPVSERLGTLEELLGGRLARLDLALPAERSAVLSDLGPRIDAVAQSALTRADLDAAITPVSGAVAEALERLAGVSEGLEARLDHLEASLEQRFAALGAGLTSHIDNAVLALAAALLRGPGTAPAPSAESIEAAVKDSAAAAAESRSGAEQAPVGGEQVEPEGPRDDTDGDPAEPSVGRQAPTRRRSWWKHVE